jgi:hypothetical protein
MASQVKDLDAKRSFAEVAVQWRDGPPRSRSSASVTRLVQGGHYLQFCEGAMPRELLAATGAAEPRNRDIMPLPLVHGHPI